MIRVTAIELALVATPFVLFLCYRAILAARRAEAGHPIDETPYQILFLSGAALALVALVTVVLLRRDHFGPHDQVCFPGEVVDGEIEPAFCVTREEAIARGLIEDVEPDEDFDPDTPNPPHETAGGPTGSGSAP